MSKAVWSDSKNLSDLKNGYKFTEICLTVSGPKIRGEDCVSRLRCLALRKIGHRIPPR